MPATTTKWVLCRYANLKRGSEDRLYGTFGQIIPKIGGGFIVPGVTQGPSIRSPAAVENLVQ